MADTVRFAIDHSRRIPRYYQIKMNLRRLCDDGFLKPGDLLPSEHELVQLYGVSRLTVRQAIGELVAEGLLVRKQGIGTFVAQPKPMQIQPSPMGFSARILAAGFSPSSRVLSIEECPAPKGVAARLGVPEGTPIFELVRVRMIDGEPVMVETARVVSALAPGLPEHDLTGSLYQILEEAYGIVLAQGEQFVEPILLTEYDAELLNAKKGSPALLVDSIAWDKDGKAVDASQGVLRGDKTRYYFRLRTEKEPGAADSRVVR